MEFRPCPSYPGYSSSIDGDIRRDAYERRNKKGMTTIMPARMLTHLNGRYNAFVTLNGVFTRWVVMRDDAWGMSTPIIKTYKPRGEPSVETYDGSRWWDVWNPLSGPRPVSDYPDGRIVTLQDYWEQLRSA
jgi:hypothetical protein